MLEGRRFAILTDHKLLTHALHRSSDPWMPRQCRQLDYITYHTSDICHVAGVDNIMADTLSQTAGDNRWPKSASLGGCQCKSALWVSGSRQTGRQV
jgi:hypothetical protein